MLNNLIQKQIRSLITIPKAQDCAPDCIWRCDISVDRFNIRLIGIRPICTSMIMHATSWPNSKFGTQKHQGKTKTKLEPCNLDLIYMVAKVIEDGSVYSIVSAQYLKKFLPEVSPILVHRSPRQFKAKQFQTLWPWPYFQGCDYF